MYSIVDKNTNSIKMLFKLLTVDKSLFLVQLYP